MTEGRRWCDALLQQQLVPVVAFQCCWGCGAGLRRLAPVTQEHVDAAIAANAGWLEDAIVHLLCVLALDRFADYVSDQVSAGTVAELHGMCMLLEDTLLVKSCRRLMAISLLHCPVVAPAAFCRTVLL